MMDILPVIVLICVLTSSCADKLFDDEEYSRMPPVIFLDEFGPCLRARTGRYCAGYGGFVPGDTVLMDIMKKFSEPSSIRFNHTRAFFGRCITQSCKIEATISDPKHLLEACLNRTVWDEYRLKVKIESKVHCYEHGEKIHDTGTAEKIVAAILLGFIIFNAVGSLFDIYCQEKWKDGFVGMFLLSFSLPRNWRILTAPPRPDPKTECLRGIYGIRAISMVLVIIAHGLMPAMVGPQNPGFIEGLYELTVFQILVNGTLIMQTFFFMSAFLLVYFLQLHDGDISWRTLFQGILKRWLRLSLPYIVVLAVTATWLPRVGSGPIWGVMMAEHCASCRLNWWQHVLYVNNYDDRNHCMPETWYVAADMQLYCLGLAVVVFCRSPRSRLVVLSSLLLLGLLAPALHTYYQDLDGLLLASPTSASQLFASDPTFNVIYKRGHTNLASYVLGLAAGYLVHHVQNNNYDTGKLKAWRVLYWLILPVCFAIIISCQVFYGIPRVSVFYRAVAAAFVKPLFGLLMGAIVLGTIFKIESVYRGVVSWRGWVLPSRVSYCAYLLHVTYIRLTFGSMDYPLRMTVLRGLEMVVFTVVVVELASCGFWLTVEAPLSSLVKTCLHKSQTKPVLDNNKKTE